LRVGLKHTTFLPPSVAAARGLRDVTVGRRYVASNTDICYAMHNTSIALHYIKQDCMLYQTRVILNSDTILCQPPALCYIVLVADHHYHVRHGCHTHHIDARMAHREITHLHYRLKTRKGKKMKGRVSIAALGGCIMKTVFLQSARVDQSEKKVTEKSLKSHESGSRRQTQRSKKANCA
jgi:hypothetical protein